MKIKSFLAVLIAGILCVTSFVACDDDDDDDKVYGYEAVVDLTDPGDLSAANITTLETAFTAEETAFGTQYMSKGDAKKAFDAAVSAMDKSLSAAIRDNTKTVKITFGLFNTGTQKLEFSKVFSIEPVE